MKKLVILLFFLTACGAGTHSPIAGEEPSNNIDVNEPARGGEEEICAPSGMPVVVFEDVQSQIFSASCTQCHSEQGGNAAGINLENFSNIKDRIGQLQDSINQGRMPPVFAGGELPESDKNLLASWVNLKTPETLDDLNACEN